MDGNKDYENFLERMDSVDWTIDESMLDSDEEETIEHYGVKGMKWGVRRYQPYSGSSKVGKFVDRAKQRKDVKKQEKIDKKYIKRTNNSKGLIAAEIYNDAVHEMNNGGIEKFNKKWNDKKVDHLNDPKLREEYYNDYEKEFQKVARKYANAATTESATGNIRTEYKYNPGSIIPTAIHVVTEKGKNVIQQSDDDDVIVYKITHDSKGFIEKLTRDSEKIQHYQYVESGEEFLQHHGVKGMKWGVRRYQPYPKGQQNAGKFLDAAKQTGSANQNGGKSTKVTEGSGTADRTKATIRSKGREMSMVRAQREIKNLSTKDAQQVVSRSQLENRLKRLSETRNVGDEKAKRDYLNRESMSNEELKRKVDRLQISDNMRVEARKANQGAIDVGKKVAKIAAPIAVSLVLNGEVNKKWLKEVMPADMTSFDSIQNLHNIGKQAAQAVDKLI